LRFFTTFFQAAIFQLAVLRADRLCRTSPNHRLFVGNLLLADPSSSPVFRSLACDDTRDVRTSAIDTWDMNEKIEWAPNRAEPTARTNSDLRCPHISQCVLG
jgi:hypothetical protein